MAKADARNLAKVTLMKIAVAHHTLNIPGGAERLCLSVIEALRNQGHDISLVTVEKTNWEVVRKNFGAVVLPNKEIYATTNRVSKKLSSLPISLTYFSVFAFQLLATKSKHEHDLTINTFGDAINSLADITYIHFPLRAAMMFSQIPAFTDQSMWRKIAPVYTSAMSLLDRVAPGDLLTNSKFTREIIKTVLNMNSVVVYPPVNTETFSSRCFRERKEENIVAVVASYTPKRHLEQVPLIAKHSKNARFLVMGKADEFSQLTLQKLRDSLNKLHVEDRVTLLQNVPFEDFTKHLSNAKAYLHVMPQDHFGISVVEAMASGCVPVVHRSGGPWVDILDQQQGKYGFSYSTAAEAAKYIDRLISDEDLRSTIASRASHRARKFDKKVFMNRIVNVVEEVAG